jgi:hypothetical protein
LLAEEGQPWKKFSKTDQANPPDLLGHGLVGTGKSRDSADSDVNFI